MSRIIVAALFFVAVIAGFGLGALGVPSEVAIASGLLVTGAALLLTGLLPALKGLKGRVPVNVSVVGAVFAGLGALLFIVGLAA